jgi:hypothetical protein
MSILVDFFAANEAELEQIAPDVMPWDVLNTVQFNGITDVQLAGLAELLLDIEFEEGLDEIEALTPSEEGPWLFRFSDGLTEALAALEDGKQRQTAKRWAKAMPEDFEGWEATEVLELMETLVDVSKAALNTGRKVYYWTSL